MQNLYRLSNISVRIYTSQYKYEACIKRKNYKEGLYKKGVVKGLYKKLMIIVIGLFFLLYFCQSIPRKHAGSLVPCALWCATQAQQRPCRGQSLGQGHDMLLCGQGMVSIH